MDKALSAFGDMIEAATALSVGVGHPGSVAAQIVLWPWHISRHAPSLNNKPTPGARLSRGPAISISLFLISRSGLDALVHAGKCLMDSPVLDIDGVSYQMREHDVPQELQSEIFGNTGIPMQPAWSYILQG